MSSNFSIYGYDPATNQIYDQKPDGTVFPTWNTKITAENLFPGKITLAHPKDPTEVKQACPSRSWWGTHFKECTLPLGHAEEHEAVNASWDTASEACMYAEVSTKTGQMSFCSESHSMKDLQIEVHPDHAGYVKVTRKHFMRVPGMAISEWREHSLLRSMSSLPPYMNYMKTPVSSDKELARTKAQDMINAGGLPPHVIKILKELIQ